jgi:hypothetical protein
MLSCGKAKLMIKELKPSVCICNNQRKDTVLPLAQKERVDETAHENAIKIYTITANP